MSHRHTDVLLTRAFPSWLGRLMLSVTAVLCIVVVWGAMAAPAGAQSGGTSVVPKVGLYIKEADIARARERIKTEAWAKKELDAIIQLADFWALFPARWYHGLIPPEGSLFSYGRTGCPVDGSPWPNFGGGGVAELSRPMVLRCPSTGTTLDFNNPESKYYDPGDGVVIDGVRYHLRGVWNSFVVNQMAGWGNDQGAVHNLTYAYVLTGNEKYARTALTIMDALATLMPTTIGPRDFQRSDTSVEGRLHWLTSIVHRSKMHLIRNYDLLYNVPMMHEVSPTNPTNYGKVDGAFTIRENIEQNMLKDYVFGEYDLRNGNLVSLHNHEADEFRAMLALGIVLDIPDWVQWGVSGALSFLDNTIDRDGLYYETSLGYGNFAQGVYLDMAEILYNYDPANYPGQAMPNPADYPYGLNLYDHPKLKKFIVGFRGRVDAAGRLPAYGNAGSPTNPITVATRAVTQGEWNQVEMFHARTSSEVDRQFYAAWLRDASQGNITNQRKGIWNLFHATDVAPGASGQGIQDDIETNVLGGAGLAILRAGTGTHRRAVLLRVGPNLPHAHDDILGLLIHAKGYELTGDVGYGTFGSPVHLGWGTRQIAHNLVVVNEGLRRNASTHHVGPGGDLLALLSAPGVSFVEMEAPQMFVPQDGVEMYRRGVALIDVSDTDSYIVDLFRVVGGKTHDYAFHSLATDLRLTDINPQAIPDVWTLWGRTEPNATFDAAGRSWGERILSGEHIRDLGIPAERVATRFWTPEPGNGYGFIHDVKEAVTEQPFTSIWRMNDPADTRLALTLVPQGPLSVVQAKGPDLLGKRQMGFLVVRNEAEPNAVATTLYQAVIEPYRGEMRLVSKVEALPVQSDHELVAVLKITLNQGVGTDYIISAPDGHTVVLAEDEAFDLRLSGGWGMVRAKAGSPEVMHLVGGSELSFGEWAVAMDGPAWRGQIVAVDYANSRLVVDVMLPPVVLAGRALLIHNELYAHNSSYTVHGVATDEMGRSVIDLGDTSLSLSRGTVESLTSGGRILSSRTPFPWGYQYNTPTRYFDGKLIINERTGAETRVGAMTAMKTIALPSEVTAEQFASGDEFVIYDAQPGDTFVIPHGVSVVIRGNVIEVTATADLRLRLPSDVAERGLSRFDPDTGAWERIDVVNNWVVLDLASSGYSSVSLRVGE